MRKHVLITSGIYPTHGIFSLIKYISYSLLSNKKFKKNYSLTILIFKENFLMKLKKVIFNIFLNLRNFFLNEKMRIHKFSYSAKEFIDENNDLKKYFRYFSKENDYIKFNPNLVFPLISGVEKKNFLSIGYIYDLQHRDLPKLFSKKEIKMRTNQFKTILQKNDSIVVNSKFVKKRILKNFNIKKRKIDVIPFLPFIYDKKKKINFNIRNKYKIGKNFFIVCNRFWKHKNHEIIFKAFKNFLKYKPNFQLVCTGDTSDTRFPAYFDNLKKEYYSLIKSGKIRILEIIPRPDQLKLIELSKAVVQPTLYEGGPGGFSSYEAISLGKKLILSNISINREIKSKNITFFSPNSHEELTQKLLITSKQYLSKKNWKKHSKINKIKLGNYFLKLIEETLTSK